MRILVCGGRSYCDIDTLYRTLDHLDAERDIATVVTGGCSGADQLAELWARERDKVVIVVPAQWGVYGRSAGPKRNESMLDLNPDLVVAFKGGRGTQDMVNRATEKGIPVKEIE